MLHMVWVNGVQQKEQGFKFSVVTLACLCVASDETPGGAGRRRRVAEKGIIMAAFCMKLCFAAAWAELVRF